MCVYMCSVWTALGLNVQNVYVEMMHGFKRFKDQFIKLWKDGRAPKTIQEFVKEQKIKDAERKKADEEMRAALRGVEADDMTLRQRLAQMRQLMNRAENAEVDQNSAGERSEEGSDVYIDVDVDVDEEEDEGKQRRAFLNEVH